MDYYDEKLLMRHLDSLRDDSIEEFNASDIQTLYSSKICNSLNSRYFNVDGSLKLKHKYNIPKIDMRSIMDSVSNTIISTPIQYTPTDVKLAQKMYDIWLEHEQIVEE